MVVFLCREVPSLLSKGGISHMYSHAASPKNDSYHSSGTHGRSESDHHLDTSDVSGGYLAVTETSGVPVKAFVIGFPDALQSGENSLLKLWVDLWEKTGKTWIFELEGKDPVFLLLPPAAAAAAATTCLLSVTTWSH